MTILIAEDDRSFRKGLAFELMDAGYKVTEAENGKQAIEFIKKKQFDLVISDLVMPEADGLDVYYTLQRSHPETKFILLTAFCDDEKARVAKKLFKDNFLNKSTSHELLIEKITQIL